MPEEQDKNNEKIQSLREMIHSAETTLQGAKAMLLQLEGKKKVGRKRKSVESEDGNRIVEGSFDGQIMLGTDGKQYPVPANYASKSKLVHGDMLKLTITSDGSFIYKQIGPVERKTLIGVVHQDSNENYFVTAEGKPFKVLLASITYFKAEPGDEVALVVPRDIESDWGAIENVIHSAKKDFVPTSSGKVKSDFGLDFLKEDEPKKEELKEETEEEKKKREDDQKLIDEWAPNLEELEKELNSGKEEKAKDEGTQTPLNQE
jgi:hypothetical protein